MAKPRTPSSTGRCPRRLGRGLALAGTGAPDVATRPGFDGGVTCACADPVNTLAREPIPARQKLSRRHASNPCEFGRTISAA